MPSHLPALHFSLPTCVCTFTQALEKLSALLGVKASLVEEMLTQRVVKTRTEVFTKQLGVQDASLTRDAIVKSLYEVGRVEDGVGFCGGSWR